jgi:NAD(P)-dependent dehydrogenase (short-subunit alcohol dehydrogenase family)
MNIYKDKVAIVTGAASGIGKALAEELARRGAKTSLSDINEEALKQTVDGIQATGGKASGQIVDVTDYEAFKKHIEQTAEQEGRLDYLFNNAGLAIIAELLDMEIEHWRKVLDVDLNGVFYGSLAAYKLMAKQGFGHIVNLSSVEGLIPFPANSAYVASKYAVLGLSQTMWVEGGGLGVNVTAVCPGYVKTPIFDVTPVINIDRSKVLEQYKVWEKFGVTPEECAGIILKGVAKNKPIILVSKMAHIMWRFARLRPILTMKLIRRDFEKWRNKVRATW